MENAINDSSESAHIREYVLQLEQQEGQDAQNYNEKNLIVEVDDLKKKMISKKQKVSDLQEKLDQ